MNTTTRQYAANQEALFELISTFAVDTVVGWSSMIYRTYGPKLLMGDAFVPLIIRPAEVYFNHCAKWIYNREDDFINEKFDKMMEIKLQNRYDPVDLLNIIVMLSLDAVQNMEISSIVSDNYELTMSALTSHVKYLVNKHRGLSSGLIGCTPDHIHYPIDENIFSFSYDQYAMVDGNPVKLSRL